MVTRRPGQAVAASLILHFMVDAINHTEPFDENKNLRLDLFALDGLLLALGLAVVAKRFGPLSPPCLGALAGALPDTEHVARRRLAFVESTVHGHLPHGVWPSKPIGLRHQFLAGAAAWLALSALSTRFPSAGRTVVAGGDADPASDPHVSM
jgi:hypothetical protein